MFGGKDGRVATESTAGRDGRDRRWPIDDAAAVLACFEDSATEVFRWLCRIGGREAAPDAMVSVYVGLAAAADEVDVDRIRLFCDGLRSVRTGPAVDGLAPGIRAVVDLALVEGLPDTTVGAVTGRGTDEIAAARDDAARELDRLFPGTDPDVVLRAEESWLDDALRDRCRAAITSGAAGRRVGGRPVPADQRRLPSTVSRRPTLRTAAAIVLALGAVGAAAWAIADDDTAGPDAASTETAASTTNTPGQTTTTVPATLVQRPGFVLDPLPAGFSTAVISESVPAGPPTGWLEVWTSPGATRTGGRWFTIVSAQCTPFGDTIAAVSVASDADGPFTSVSASTSADGVSTITRQEGSNPATARTLEITGFGLTLDQLAAIASTVVTDDGVKDPSETPVDDCTEPSEPVAPGFTAGFADLHPGISKIAAGAVHANTLEQGEAVGADRSVVYVSGDGTSSITITTRAHDEVRSAVFELLTDVLPGSPDRAVIGDRVVSIGQTATIRSAARSTLTWREGPDDVTVSGQLPLDEMLLMVHDVRLATSEEWIARG